MIELLKGFPDNIVALACKGQVTRRDYETVLVPAVEKALKQHRNVRVYYQIGAEFVGNEQITVFTALARIRHTIKIFSFLMPGEVKIFPTSEAAEAREWIVRA
jgi:hypothetical protein